MTRKRRWRRLLGWIPIDVYPVIVAFVVAELVVQGSVGLGFTDVRIGDCIYYKIILKKN